MIWYNRQANVAYDRHEVHGFSIERLRDLEVASDWETFADAKAVAGNLNKQGEVDGSPRRYLAVDRGAHCAPRYDVIVQWQVGDEVSGSFNGDTYPHGRIVSISPSLKVIRTDDGSVFYRRRESGAWVLNGTWVMVAGTITERNPSF